MHSGKELIGIGVDSVAWDRMERFLADHSPEFVERLLSPVEQKSFRTSSNPLQFFARAFAAKEAFFKAFNHSWMGGGAGFRQIEIVMSEASKFQVACDYQTDGEFFSTPDGIGAQVAVWGKPE